MLVVEVLPIIPLSIIEGLSLYGKVLNILTSSYVTLLWMETFKKG